MSSPTHRPVASAKKRVRLLPPFAKVSIPADSCLEWTQSLRHKENQRNLRTPLIAQLKSGSIGFNTSANSTATVSTAGGWRRAI